MRALDTGLKSRDGRIYRPREKAINARLIREIVNRRNRHLDDAEKWTVRLARELGLAGMVK